MANLRAIGLTLVAAMALTIAPLPDWARFYRPEWVALVILYWSITLPRTMGIGPAWFIGLVMDILHGVLLGQHALGFAIIAYIGLRFHQRLQSLGLIQQVLMAALILLPYKSVSLWVEGIRGHSPDTWLYWAPVITSMLVWPWLYLLLRAFSPRAAAM